MLEENFISVTEFAKHFRVSTTLVYKLIKEHHIPAIQIGKRNFRISSKTVEGIENCGMLDK
jgi:excisionase family DNA binding protein